MTPKHITWLEVGGAYKASFPQFPDSRGEFMELFRVCRQPMNDFAPIVQVSVSRTALRGTIRGLHGQTFMAKLVYCVAGEAFDVILDTRRESSTYGKSSIIDMKPGTLVHVPEHCVHGFQSITNCLEIVYLYSATYQPPLEFGVRYDDPFVGVEWPLPVTNISERDKSFPRWEP